MAPSPRRVWTGIGKDNVVPDALLCLESGETPTMEVENQILATAM